MQFCQVPTKKKRPERKAANAVFLFPLLRIKDYTPNFVVRTGTPMPMVEATVTERR